MIQFVVLKPVCAIATIVLLYLGWYKEGELSLNNGYLYIVIIDNISVTIALYMLIMFYHALQKELAPYKPIAKFLCIKAIILFAMWQAIGVAVGQYYHIFEYLKG